MPTAAETPNASASDHQVIAAGIGENASTSSAVPTPSAIPVRPPTEVSSTASSRNCTPMSRGRAPTALRRPISRVRSRTETSMMLETPTPPTSSEMPAMAASTPVSTPRMSPSTPRICRWVTALNSVSGCRRDSSATIRSPSSSIRSRSGALTAMPSMRCVPQSRCAAVTGTCTSSSRSTPRLCPSGAKTPITRNRTPASVTCWPSGSRSGKSARATESPSTATRRLVSTSAPVR